MAHHRRQEVMSCWNLSVKIYSIDYIPKSKDIPFKFPDKLYLLLWFLRKLPVIGFKVVKLIKLHADVFYRELKQIPEPCQVLRRWSWVSVYVL